MTLLPLPKICPAENVYIIASTVTVQWNVRKRVRRVAHKLVFHGKHNSTGMLRSIPYNWKQDNTYKRNRYVPWSRRSLQKKHIISKNLSQTLLVTHHEILQNQDLLSDNIPSNGMIIKRINIKLCGGKQGKVWSESNLLSGIQYVPEIRLQGWFQYRPSAAVILIEPSPFFCCL